MQSPETISLTVRRAAAALQIRLQELGPQVRDAATGDPFYPQLAAAIRACLVELESTRLWGPENRLPSSQLWDAVGDTLCRGWLQNQARIKPRGYAGDYEMLARIYENRRCDDPLGRLLDRYFQEEAAPQAVRNRMQMMSEWIVAAAETTAHPLRVAIVGSAFGLEVRDALLALQPAQRSRIAVTLLDMDPAALAFAREQLTGLLPEQQIVSTATNVFRLADRPRLAEPLAGSHLLFCPGLFDYLDDASATAMLRLFWNCLAPEGRATIFQFAPHNPSRGYMEWLGNWYLLYRDAEQCRALAQQAGIPPAAVEIGAEGQGIDLFLTVRRV
ncbi:MAG: hypothetical protein WD872_06935 [Pirellulaceae bacterium]